MKKNQLPLLFPFILFFIATNIFGQKVIFTSQPVNVLMESMDSTQKIFVYVVKTGDEICKEMNRAVLSDSITASFLNYNFLNKIIYVDDDSLDKHYLAEYLIQDESNVVPAYYFLDNDGHVLLKDSGLKSKKEILEMSYRACQMLPVRLQIAEKKKLYSANRSDKTFLRDLLVVENEIGDSDTTALYDLLALLSKDEYLDISVIRAILNNEQSIYGKGYRYISESKNRSLAAIICCRENNRSMDDIMYAKAMEIIQNNMTSALESRDEMLFEDCKIELQRVMNDKEKAQKICDRAHRRFYR
ncbi:hypothetical protein [Saccharicrinis sp. FJH54]|uniref:hypothetical protein n=1 Tax=Saccharicrinis sp. FJH54 TaxID=3344665 RepID=UPI0035D44B05